MSIANAVEARQGPEAARDLELLFAQAGIGLEPLSPEHRRIAVDAWRRFGKGRHPTGLNLGHCFAYALARDRGDSLLFNGEDFARTDIPSALG